VPSPAWEAEAEADRPGGGPPRGSKWNLLRDRCEDYRLGRAEGNTFSQWLARINDDEVVEVAKRLWRA
jgi:hypothetical protein